MMLVFVQIPSKDHGHMEPWTCPGQWPDAERQAHQRSMSLLDNVVLNHNGVDMELDGMGLPRLWITGHSNRIYKVETLLTMDTYHDERFGFYDEPRFDFSVVGGCHRKDVCHETDATALICLHAHDQHRHLPAGDQLVGLALALVNDRATALRIPLLAQFLAADERLLSTVYQFSADGVVRYDDFCDALEIEPSLVEVVDGDDFFSLDADMMWAIDRWEHRPVEAEARRMDDWFEDIDRRVRHRQQKAPWHHDEGQIWALEERLRRD